MELTGAGNFVSFPKYLSIVAENSPIILSFVAVMMQVVHGFAKAGETLRLRSLHLINSDVCQITNTVVLLSYIVAPIPAQGGVTGTIGATSYNHVRVANSTNNITQTVSEIGVFNFTATPQVLTMEIPIRLLLLAPTGNMRFVPAYFAVTIPQTPSLNAACTPHSYIGQPFSYLIEPRLALNPSQRTVVWLQTT